MRSASRNSSVARSLGVIRAHAGAAASAAATAAFSWLKLASGTSAMHWPVAGSNIRSTAPSPATRAPSINSLVCMSAHRRALFLLDIVEGQSMRHRRAFEIFAADFQLCAMHRNGDIEARDGHRLAGYGRHHGAGDDPHLLVAGIHRIAHIRGRAAIHQQTEDLEALFALQAKMGVCAIEIVFPRTDGEVEAEFPETVAGRILVEGIHLGHVVRIEQQRAFDPQVIQGGETGRNDAERLAFGEDGVPDEAGVFALAEDLIAALAGIAGSRDRHWTAE